jgi:hypothetical protein
MCYCGRGNRESDSGWDEKGKKKSRKAGAGNVSLGGMRRERRKEKLILA